MDVAGHRCSGSQCPPLNQQSNLQFSTTRSFLYLILMLRQAKMFAYHLTWTGLLLSRERRIIHVYAKYHGQIVTWTKGRCYSLRPHLPFWKSYFPPFLFLCKEWLYSYFKIRPVVLPSLNVTVTRKRGLNLSNGSSPVLRPLWLAIQYICQAGVTLCCEEQALGEMNERSPQQQLHSCKLGSYF